MLSYSQKIRHKLHFKKVGMAKKYANKVGMMHKNKGQRIGKAPSLHLFKPQLDSMLES